MKKKIEFYSDLKNKTLLLVHVKNFSCMKLKDLNAIFISQTEENLDDTWEDTSLTSIHSYTIFLNLFTKRVNFSLSITLSKSIDDIGKYLKSLQKIFKSKKIKDLKICNIKLDDNVEDLISLVNSQSHLQTLTINH
mmetsp:Transcript_1163/g.1051  ORF Transcript_1163/g.1051 Transcript_1163/m.1051 type:complete len:136 (+) Transcript_1163:1117-1524(+)